LKGWQEIIICGKAWGSNKTLEELKAGGGVGG